MNDFLFRLKLSKIPSLPGENMEAKAKKYSTAP